MSERKIIKVRDLKLYFWALKIKRDSYNLSLDAFHNVFVDHYYGASHRTLLTGGETFAYFFLNKVQGFIIINNDDTFSLNLKHRLKTGESLLLHLLKGSFRIWIGILPIISEIYLGYKEKNFIFTDFQFIELWINVLPVIGELIDVLNKHNSKFEFEPLSGFAIEIGTFTLEFLTPELTDPYIESLSKNYDAKYLIDNIIGKHICQRKDGIHIIYLGMDTKVEYKFLIKEKHLSEEDSVYMVLNEYLSNLSIETIKFLCVNLPVDMDEIRRIELEQRFSRKARGPSMFEKLLEARLLAFKKDSDK